MTDIFIPYSLGDKIRNVNTDSFVKLSAEYDTVYPEDQVISNYPPTLEAKTVTLVEEGVANFSGASLLINATDVEGEPVSLVSVSYTGSSGTLVDNLDGTYAFTPTLNFVGDVPIVYTASDGKRDNRSTYTITYTPVNDAPQVAVTNLNVEGNTVLRLDSSNMLTNASDPDAGDVLSVKTVTYVGADGAVVDNGNGSFDFTPTHGFVGNVTLGFTITDGTLDTPSTLLTITVDPAVVRDIYNTLEVYSNLEIYTT